MRDKGRTRVADGCLATPCVMLRIWSDVFDFLLFPSGQGGYTYRMPGANQLGTAWRTNCGLHNHVARAHSEDNLACRLLWVPRNASVMWDDSQNCTLPTVDVQQYGLHRKEELANRYDQLPRLGQSRLPCWRDMDIGEPTRRSSKLVTAGWYFCNSDVTSLYRLQCSVGPYPQNGYYPYATRVKGVTSTRNACTTNTDLKHVNLDNCGTHKYYR